MGKAKQIETNKRWKYCGDRNIEYGGYYWRNDGWSDYALIVRVTPFSDAGGNDNEYWVEIGSLYIPDDDLDDGPHDDVKRALDTCGITLEQLAELTPAKRRAETIYALIGYRGFDISETRNVRIGPKQPESREGPFHADTVLRANSSLESWVRRNCLDYSR